MDVETDVEGVLDDLNVVNVPETPVPHGRILDQVSNIISRPPSNYGIDIYRDCLEVLQNNF